MNSIKDYQRAIALSLNELKADLVLKNARVINVLSGQIHRTHVALAQGRIIGFGDYRARRVINLNGLYLAPGFIDGHLHLESSMVTPLEFARTVLPLGTTSVVCDPHEIANVLGIKGIKYILKANQYLPLSIYVMIPSCVPATNLETSGSQLKARHLKPLLKESNVLGLAELMNFPGVLLRDKNVLAKLLMAQDKVIDGHAPGLSGKQLSAYVHAGIKSDHESTTRQEALEKLRHGMYLMIREGSAAKNLAELIKIVNPHNVRRCMFVTDDRTPFDLLKQGHLNHIIRKAMKLGLNPISAIQMATINPAEYFGLKHLGAIAPGYQADLIAFDCFSKFNIKLVFKKGKLMARQGQLIPGQIKSGPAFHQNSIKIGHITQPKFAVKAKSKDIRVIQLVPNQIITKQKVYPARLEHGYAVSDTKRDILKIAVIERHKYTGKIGLGFVQGFGLKKGVIGSSISHDSHNIILVGTNDKDMLLAVRALQELGGGQVAVAKGRVKASLAMPLAGIISDQPIKEVARQHEVMVRTARQLGSRLTDPFVTLSFLALVPIPELKITDKGLVVAKDNPPRNLFGVRTRLGQDVVKFSLVDLFTKCARSSIG